MNHIIKPSLNTLLDPDKTVGLVAYYDAEIQGGGPDLFDLRQLYRGALSGVSWSDNCLNFDSAGDVITCGTFDLAPPMTLIVRAMWDGDNTRNNTLVAKRDSWAANNMRWMFMRTTGGYFRYLTYAASRTFTSYTVPSGVWLNIALTVGTSGSTVLLYVNGILIGAQSVTTLSTDAAAVVNIGNGQVSGTEAWSGKIKSVKMFNRILTQSEIWEHYNNPYCLFTSNNPTLFLPAESSGSSVVPMILAMNHFNGGM